MIDAVRLGQKIRILRESVSSSRKAFVRSLGQTDSPSYLIKVERGRYIPSIRYCERIADLAGIPLRDLLDERVPIVRSMDSFSLEALSLARQFPLERRAAILVVLRLLSRRRKHR